jgi:hypothetical protein
MALIAASFAVPATHAADLPDQKLSDYKVGETLRGDEVKSADLEGRVVVIEYWGTQ